MMLMHRSVNAGLKLKKKGEGNLKKYFKYSKNEKKWKQI